MSGRLLSSMFLALFEDSDFGAVANGLTSPSFEIVDKKYMNEKESLKVNNLQYENIFHLNYLPRH